MPTQSSSNVHIFVVGSIFIPDEKRVHRIQVRVTRTVQKTKHAIDICSKNPSSGLSTTFAFHMREVPTYVPIQKVCLQSHENFNIVLPSFQNQ